MTSAVSNSNRRVPTHANATSIKHPSRIFWILVALFLGSIAPRKSIAATETFVFEIIAGQPGQIGTNDGPAMEARFDLPVSIARDDGGNIYVGEWTSAIRRISTDGTVTTLAGKLREDGLVDGPGAEARFFAVAGLAVDPEGNLYAADFRNHAIRKITANGTVSTFAGGTWGYSDGIGRDAQFIWPQGLAIDTSGTIFVIDRYAENIRKITPDGAVTAIAGLEGGAVSGGLFQDVDGTGTAARFWGPSSIAFGTDGNMYVADQDNSTIRKVTPNGVVSTYAGVTKVRGTNDGPALTARFSLPHALVVDSNMNLYLTERVTGALRKVASDGTVSTVQMLDSVGQSIRFGSPEGMTIDTEGNLYVADSANRVILKGTRALALSVKAHANRSFSFSFAPSRNAVCVVEYTDSLINPNWTPLATQAAEKGNPVTLTDDIGDARQRFYRVRQP